MLRMAATQESLNRGHKIFAVLVYQLSYTFAKRMSHLRLQKQESETTTTCFFKFALPLWAHIFILSHDFVTKKHCDDLDGI